MSDLEIQSKLLRILADPKFDPSSYVKDIYKSGDQNNIFESKNQVQLLHDETAQQLKKNIYKNNSIFIDTARDISYLESEMYQLHHKLNECKISLNNMEVNTLSGFKLSPTKDDTIETSLALHLFDILDEIDGAQQLAKYKDYKILHQSDLYQMDERAGQFILAQKCKCFLIKDAFIHCSYLSSYLEQAEELRKTKINEPKDIMDKTGWPVRNHTYYKYKFINCYKLTTSAVVNIKDLSGTNRDRNSNNNFNYMFKLLIFPDAVIFKANSEQVKTEWLDMIDKAKKDQIETDKPKLEKEFSERQIVENIIGELKDYTPSGLEYKFEEWILDFPDEMEMFISQRQFNQAIDLLKKFKKYMSEQSGKGKLSSENLVILQASYDDCYHNVLEILCEDITGDTQENDITYWTNFQFSSLKDKSAPTSKLSKPGGPRRDNSSISGEDDQSAMSKKLMLDSTTYLYRPNNPNSNIAIDMAALRYLVALGQSGKALSLFLNFHVSSLIGRKISGGSYLKREGNPLIFAEKCGDAFWGIIAETAWYLLYSKDLFLKDQDPDDIKTADTPFSNEGDIKSAYSQFTVWLLRVELKRFIMYVKRQLEGTVSKNFSLLISCFAILRDQCLRLADPEFGLNLDVVYAFDDYTNNIIKAALEDQIENICEASRTKIFDDRFDSFPTFPDKSMLDAHVTRVAHEIYSSHLFEKISSSTNHTQQAITPNLLNGLYVLTFKLDDGETFEFRLAESTFSFLKLFVTYINDIRSVYSPDRYKIFKESLLHILLNHLQYLTVLLRSTKFKNLPRYIEAIKINVTYLLVQLVPYLNEAWSGMVGYRDDFKSLDKLTIDDLIDNVAPQPNTEVSSDSSPNSQQQIPSQSPTSQNLDISFV